MGTAASGRTLTKIYPLGFSEIGQSSWLDAHRGVDCSGCRNNFVERLQREVAVHRETGGQPKRADASHRVPGQLLHLLGIKHLGLRAENGPDLPVVQASIPTSDDEHGAAADVQRKGFGDTTRLNAVSFSSLCDGGGGGFQLDNLSRSGALSVRKARTDF